ncbi:MAG: UbiA family prenyltransferase, partial [Candidatus Omnitrophota bacterium]
LPFLMNFLNPKTKIFILLFFLIALLYSLPPVRLKSHPFIGTFCNAFGFSMLFLIGINNLKNKLILPIYSGLLCLLFVAQLIHELAHLSQDKSEKILTTALFLGEKKIKILIISFLILAFISFCKFSFIIAGFLFLLTFHIAILLTKKEINYSSLRKIYRYEGLVFGIILLLYLSLKNISI